MGWLRDGFVTPASAELPTGHHLRPIRAADTAIDYPAVMGSRALDALVPPEVADDDGSPLGSEHNDECAIDSISQSWAVLSGGVPHRFAERAMDAVRQWRFEPARDAGRRAVPEWVTVETTYRLF